MLSPGVREQEACFLPSSFLLSICLPPFLSSRFSFHSFKDENEVDIGPWFLSIFLFAQNYLADFKKTKHYLFIILCGGGGTGHRTTPGNQFSPSSMWLPGIELQPSELAARSFSCWVIFLAPWIVSVVQGHWQLLGPSFFFLRCTGAKTTILLLFLLFGTVMCIHDLNSQSSFPHHLNVAEILSEQR